MSAALRSFELLSGRCERLRGQQEALLSELGGVQEEIIDLQERRSLYTKVVEALKFIVEKATKEDLQKVEKFVTMGLQRVIHDQKISCLVQAEGASKVHITGKKGDFEGPFVESFGGGVWNVVSVILRIITILRMKQRKRLFLDESLNNLHVSYLGNVGDLLKSLVEKLGFKALMITHQEKLAERADRVYQASLKGGEFVLEKVE